MKRLTLCLIIILFFSNCSDEDSIPLDNIPELVKYGAIEKAFILPNQTIWLFDNHSTVFSKDYFKSKSNTLTNPVYTKTAPFSSKHSSISPYENSGFIYYTWNRQDIRVFEFYDAYRGSGYGVSFPLTEKKEIIDAFFHNDSGFYLLKTEENALELKNDAYELSKNKIPSTSFPHFNDGFIRLIDEKQGVCLLKSDHVSLNISPDQYYISKTQDSGHNWSTIQKLNLEPHQKIQKFDTPSMNFWWISTSSQVESQTNSFYYTENQGNTWKETNLPEGWFLDQVLPNKYITLSSSENLVDTKIFNLSTNHFVKGDYPTPTKEYQTHFSDNNLGILYTDKNLWVTKDGSATWEKLF